MDARDLKPKMTALRILADGVKGIREQAKMDLAIAEMAMDKLDNPLWRRIVELALKSFLELTDYEGREELPEFSVECRTIARHILRAISNGKESTNAGDKV